jgi:hypothetical protein
MRILFVMKHPAALRSLAGVVSLLCEHGHSLHLAFAGIKTGESHGALRRLAKEHSGLTFGSLPGLGRSPWSYLGSELRGGIDYLRYLEPDYADAPKLRARAEKSAPVTVRRVGRAARRLAGPGGVVAVRRTLQLLEGCLAPQPQLVRFLAEQEPDLVLATHLVTGLGGAGLVRAAKQLGIHTAYLVFSWDNLTNKGLIRDVPDAVLVWNEFQEREAVEMHGVPRERLRVTGAPSYDHWFSRSPSRRRDEFCRLVGLRGDQPIVLYACSSPFVAPEEVGFVRRWVEALRAHGGLPAEAGILVRPHPRNAAQWARAELALPQVSVWPPLGEEPVEEKARQNYFDSLFHAAAVVGINTSAQIEGAIVGRPVHTVLADEFRDTQQGTLHFHYLQAEEFGHLHVARTLEEHAALLEESLRGDGDDERNRRFVRRFVRPLGLEVPASPLVVEVIEELAARAAPVPSRGPALAPVVRLGLSPVAVAAARRADRRSSRPKPPKLPREPRLLVRKLAKDPSGAPIVAGPWLGDEIGELLYWIPFLRWAQGLKLGVRERLVVVCRLETAYWYAGIGSRRLHLEELVGPEQVMELQVRFPEAGLGGPLTERLTAALDGNGGFQLLEPRVVASARAGLAAQSAGLRLHARRLEFEPLTPPDLPAGLELPKEFVAVRFGFDAALPGGEAGTQLALAVIDRVAAGGPLVVLDPPEALREALDSRAEEGGVCLLLEAGYALQSAVVARSDALFGSYGATAYLAALHGVSAIALYADEKQVDQNDLRLAASFLGRPPFGSLSTICTEDGPRATATRVDLLLGRKARSLAAVEPGPSRP